MSKTKLCRCDCGSNTGHTTEAECRTNRAATIQMQERQFAPALPWVERGGVFVRLCEGDENGLAHGATVADGVVKRYRL